MAGEALHRALRLMSCFRLWAAGLLTALLFSCATVKIAQPPTFDYPVLLDSFFHSNPDGHFPVIIQKGMNTDPSVSDNGYLFYASDAGGSSSIWMRQLRTTVNLPVVEQPASQTSPAISADGRLLAYVSFDRDPAGDILVTDINPDEVARRALLGDSVPNFFQSSYNLSSYIEEETKNDAPSCRGRFAELDPFISRDRSAIYFASNRCEGTFRIWKVGLNKHGRPEGKPVAIISISAIQPVVGRRTLAATALGADGRPEGFLILNLETGQSRIVKPPRLREGLAMRPVLSADERSLFFMFIAGDTNGDGKVDRNDRGGVYALSLTDESIRHIVDDSMPVYSIALSSYLQNGILYSAYEGGRARIFLSRPEGLILKKENAFEQYTYALTFTDPERRALALESVSQYYSSAPEFFLFEVDVLVDLQEALRQSFMRDEREAYAKTLNEALKANPYAPLALELHGTVDPARLDRALHSPILDELSSDRRRTVESWVRDRLASVLEQRGEDSASLAQLQMLNVADPYYFNRKLTLLREAALSVRLHGTIPDRFREILSRADTEDRLKQRVLQIVFEEARRGLPGLDPGREQQPLLRGLLYILEGQEAFQQRKYDDARKLVLEGLKSTGEGNLAYTYGWKVLASIYEIQQKPTQALEARLRFLTSYRKEWNLDVDESDFQRLIDSSRTFIDSFRASATSIAEDVEDRLDYRKFLIGQLGPASKNERVRLRLPDRNLLTQFCTTDSPSGLLVRNLGYREYMERYTKLCDSVEPYLSGTTKDLSLEEAHEVSELFYLVSYANANLINILFLQFRAAGLFDDLHRTWSVHYHRLKTDIAMERFKRNLTWEEKKTELLNTGAVTALISGKDPFDARIFDEIMVGYKFAEEDARRYFDFSLLYGYAYLLIRKSEERETFYDTLLRRGVKISNSELEQRKASVLDDLKQAEYRLQYIMNVDPGFVDATLLLSWLYQYVDSRKDTPVAQEIGPTERNVREISGLRTRPVTDGVFFRSEYENYFNGRYYERNVDLLSDAIDETRRKGVQGRERDLALLNLNLGNNHFQLINYRAASEAYDAAESLSARVRSPIFEGWLQETLFHVNRGRARFYSAQTGPAASDFAKAVELLSEHEYWPAFEESNRSAFSYRADPGSTYLRARADRRRNDLARSRYRLAFAQSLRGLALQESGDLKEAIGAYREAIRLLYGSEPVPPDLIDQSGLKNYIAMAFQDLEDFERSDVAATSAGETASAEGLTVDEGRFRARTVGGRILGMLLGYGEDFSVIGDGRTPFGFSSLRQYELSLGIRLRNSMRQGDLDSAANVLAQRAEIFKSRDGGRRLGREGIVYAKNQEAEIALDRQSFKEAFDLYRESAKTARKSGLLSSFRLNFRNSYFALFQQIESGGYESPKKIDRMIRDALDDLVDFRETYRNAAKDLYVKQRSTEDPAFSYTEARDDPILDRAVLREVGDFTAIEGLLYFYRYQMGQRMGSAVSLQKEMLDLAEHRLTVTAGIDEGAPTLAGIRARLNLARVLLAERETKRLQALIERLQEETFEFNTLPERFELLMIEADFALARGEARSVAMGFLTSAETLLRENSYLLPVVADRIDLLFGRHVDLSLREGRLAEALSLLEELRACRLQTEFYRFPLDFPESDAKEIFGLLRQHRSRLRWLAGEETRLRITRSNVSEILRTREKEAVALKEKEREFLRLEPGLADFVSLPGFALPAPSDPLRYLRLVATPDGITCVRIQNGLLKSTSIPRREIELEDHLSGFVGACAGAGSPDTVLVVDAGSVESGVVPALVRVVRQNSHLAMRTTLNDRSPVFINRSPEIESRYNIFNITRVGPGGEENVVSISSPPSRMIFAKGEGWSARRWLSGKQTAAVALLPVDISLPDGKPVPEEERLHLRAVWEGLVYSYEVFRSAGGGTLLAGSNIGEQQRSDALLSGAASPLKTEMIFGTAGFDRIAMADGLRQKHRETFQQAIAKVDEDPRLALRLFELADGYLSGLPDYEEAGAKNRAALAGTLITVDPERGDQFYGELLSREKEKSRRLSVVRSWMTGLAAAGSYSRSAEVLQMGVVEFPEEKARFFRDRQAIQFLERLEKSSPAEKEPIPGAEVLREAFFSDRKLGTKAALLLYRHGELDAALLLADSAGPAVSLDLKQRIALERSFFTGNGVQTILSRMDRGNISGDDLLLFWSAVNGKWEYYDDFLRSRANVYSGYQWDQKALLYRILRRRLKEHATSLEEMTCLPVPRAKRNLFDAILFRQDKARTESSACELLTPTEQAMFVRMALDSLPFDSTGQVRVLLRQLIEAVRARSSLRADRFALLAAEGYLRLRMPDQAQKFLALYTSSPGGALPSMAVDLSRLNAFTTLWVYTLKKDGEPERLQTALRDPYGSALAGALAHLEATTPLRTRALALLHRMSDPLFDDADRGLSLQLLQSRALQGNDPELLLDLIFSEKRLLQSSKDWIPEDRPAGRLLAKLPPGQTFFVLHDPGAEFVTVQLRNGVLTMNRTGKSSALLRSRLYALFQNRKKDDSTKDVASLISGEYQSLFPRDGNGIYYRWLTGIHGLAPVLPVENDLYVLDPDLMIAGPIVHGAGRFGGNFRITAVDLHHAPAPDVYRSSIQRIADWTNLEMDRLGKPGGRKLQIQEGTATGGSEDWVYFDLLGPPLPDLTPGALVPRWERFGLPLSSLPLRGMGITFRGPRDSLEILPTFLKNYLRADLPARTMIDRLDYARLRLLDLDSEDHLLLRPVAASLVE